MMRRTYDLFPTPSTVLDNRRPDSLDSPEQGYDTDENGHGQTQWEYQVSAFPILMNSPHARRNNIFKKRFISRFHPTIEICRYQLHQGHRENMYPGLLLKFNIKPDWLLKFNLEAAFLALMVSYSCVWGLLCWSRIQLLI
jgi:hypothetical protein